MDKTLFFCAPGLGNGFVHSRERIAGLDIVNSLD